MNSALEVTSLSADNDLTDIVAYGVRIQANAADATQRLGSTSLDMQG